MTENDETPQLRPPPSREELPDEFLTESQRRRLAPIKKVERPPPPGRELEDPEQERGWGDRKGKKKN